MKHGLRAHYALFGLALAGPAFAAQRLDCSQPVRLANEKVEFEFEPGGMGLRAMVDRATGLNHLPERKNKRLLWEVTLGRGRQTERVTNNYRPCTTASVERASDGSQRLTLEWKKLRWWLEDNVLSVRVTVELPAASGIARWRIAVENGSDYWGLWSVKFPFADGFPAKGTYDIARPSFGNGGLLLRKWSSGVIGRHPSGHFPMQFLSLHRGPQGVYFGTLDGEGRSKELTVEPGTSLYLLQHPENMGVPGSDLPGAYDVEFGVFTGSWVQAARHYRAWALRQKWARAGRISQRADIPRSIRDVGLWVTEGWNWRPKPGDQPRGRGYITRSGWHEAPTDSNALYLAAQQWMGVPMAMHWYHWHHNKFNHEFPNFLPARPGVAARTRELIQAGWLVMPYINGYSADIDNRDFADYREHAATDDAGGYRMSLYGDTAGRLIAMCPTTYWQDRIASLVNRMCDEVGFNAVYLDQISAVSGPLCFDRRHGHPLGGGRYWTDGYRALLEKVRRVARRNGREIVTTSEGANEVFLDLLDANLSWAQPSEQEIPLMQTVYSGFTLFFGSPCDYSRSERFFRFAQGQALIDGRQNGWMDVGLFAPEHAAKADYLRNCARYRVAAKKYLTYGDLLEPLQPLRPVPMVEEDGLGWLDKHRAAIPSAEGRLWRSEDGRLGVLLANYAADPVPFAWSVDAAVHGIKVSRFALSEITPEGVKPLGTASGVINRTETLAPAQIKFVEIAPR